MPFEGTVAVTLNYQTAEDTVRAVESLRQACPPLAAILIVDNASRDDSAVRLRRVEGVRVIEADANRGFSAGCNIGIREALRSGASRVFLLNSDAVVAPDTVALLERALSADPRLGIVGPMVLEQSNPDVVQSLGIDYNRSTGRMRHRGVGKRRVAAPTAASRRVDAVSGCAVLVRREVFEAIGLLAEEYFFGFEDLDVCLRARAAGFDTACVESATVLHEGSRSIGRESGLRAYFAARNHLLLASRVSPRRSLPAAWAQTTAIVGLNLAHVLITSDVPRAAGLGGLVRGVRDHFKGRYGFPPPT